MKYHKNQFVIINASGKVGKIVEVFEDGTYKIEVDGVLQRYLFCGYTNWNDSAYGSWKDSDLSPAPKTWETLEVGDILVNKNGEEAKVLGIFGEAILRSLLGDFNKAEGYLYTLSELKKQGFTIKGVQESIEELTMDDVCRELGRTVKIIKK